MEKGRMIDITSIAMLGLLFYFSGFSEEIGKNTGTAYGGLYLLSIGGLFLLSYFYTENSYILKFLRWNCERFSFPSGKGMAFFYFALALLIGGYLFLVGVGIFQPK